MATVLIVEDEEALRELFGFVLEPDGHEIICASDGMEAFHLLAKHKPDLVILDMMMPSISGLEVLQHIRQQGNTPVLIVSALSSEENIVRALELGADDYMAKPFSERELRVRVTALLRRAGMAAAGLGRLTYQGLVIDPSTREVWVKGERVDLTAKEFDLLYFMAQKPGVVYTRHQLLREVWQSSSEYQQESTVTEHVRRLRHHLEDDPNDPFWLQTVRGVGYRFNRRGGYQKKDRFPRAASA